MKRQFSMMIFILATAMGTSGWSQFVFAQAETALAPTDNGRTASTAPEGINTAFQDPTMDVEQWVERFEGESREIFASRERILAALRLWPGIRVADVGAGTGFFSRLLASHVGDEGWVYAVDISPAFIKHIAQINRDQGIANITPVLCAEDSVNLPRNCVDLVFVCDTYHHFEYPDKTLASIHRSLRPKGQLVVIDFEREVGKSREWVLQHVRAGRSEFTEEIVQAGFRLEEQVPIEGFKENYLLRFQKVEEPIAAQRADHEPDSQSSDP